jgi:steroid delta-isomerase-like uncharacterized protein
MNKENLLREFINEVWNKHVLESVGKYIYSEYTIYLDNADPWERKTLNHSEFKKRLNYSFNSFPDMHFEITSAIQDENHVAISWILTGTNLGMIGEYPATKRSIRTKGMTIYHFNDNLINGHTQVYDRITVMKQLGFI